MKRKATWIAALAFSATSGFVFAAADGVDTEASPGIAENPYTQVEGNAPRGESPMIEGDALTEDGETSVRPGVEGNPYTKTMGNAPRGESPTVRGDALTRGGDTSVTPGVEGNPFTQIEGNAPYGERPAIMGDELIGKSTMSELSSAPSFAEVDRNRNGLIESAEANEAGIDIEDADANQDGSLSAAEYQSVLSESTSRYNAETETRDSSSWGG